MPQLSEKSSSTLTQNISFFLLSLTNCVSINYRIFCCTSMIHSFPIHGLLFQYSHAHTHTHKRTHAHPLPACSCAFCTITAAVVCRLSVVSHSSVDCVTMYWCFPFCCVVYVKNAAGWIIAADATLRDAARRKAVEGKAFFIGDGVRTMRQMGEVSAGPGDSVTDLLWMDSCWFSWFFS